MFHSMETSRVAIQRKPTAKHWRLYTTFPPLQVALLLLVFVNSKAKGLSKVTTAIRHGDAEKYFTVLTFFKADFH